MGKGSNFNFNIYFIGGSQSFKLNKDFCDVYLKFHQSDKIFYISFYTESYVVEQLLKVGYFWNTDTIIVKCLDKNLLYKLISDITNNGKSIYPIIDNFSNCGNYNSVLGAIENIEDMLI